MTHLSVVVPVYKARACLGELHRRLTATLEGMGRDFEMILVEDCGEDGSWEVIEGLAREDPRVRGLQFSRNFGQHHGITAGLDHADGDWVVVMDCDLQDRPEEIPRLYAKACEGYDVVLARRVGRTDGAWKRLSSWLFYRVFSYLTDLRLDGSIGTFRMVSRKVVGNLRRMREQLRFFGGMVHWLGFPTATVDVEHGERFAGTTSYSFAGLVRLGSEAIIGYSDKPLYLAVRFGLSIAGLAFLYGLYIVYRAVVHSVPVVGWPSLMVSLYFLGGVVIANLGVVGIYLGKVFAEAKGRPLYVVSEYCNFDGVRGPAGPPRGGMVGSC